ncbi:MAG: DUF4105 domain-containing protein [Ginsengibacter sp.]
MALSIFKNKIRILKILLFAGNILFISSASIAQQDSCHIRISLLTATPGEELYSTFGHSALRVTDTVRNTDIVYNYGTFNFEEPNFYMKFVRGKLPFYLSTDNFDNFMAEYQYENRGVTEQVLNLTCEEKANVQMMLLVNMLGNNRGYKYDFTFDNCTTRLRDLIEKASDSTVHFGQVLHTKVTFRNLIYEYLDMNDKQWSKLGIDILLGSRMDVAATPYQVMFLPEYLMKTFDSSTIAGRPLVLDEHSLLRQKHIGETKNNLTHPFFLFVCLFVMIAFLSFSKNKSTQKILASFDGFLFFLTGLLGILVLFMWFGTDHFMCRDNLNILWAWPTNIVAAFFIHSKKSWARKYFLVYALFNILLVILWKFIPQHLNISLLPIIALLIFRSLIFILRKK